MKVAVISDIHGNMHALEAVLSALDRERPDRVVCAGDAVNPFFRSADVLARLKGLGIPVLRGNHEDYIVSYFSGDRPEIRASAQFLPIQLVAARLGPDLAHELAALPFDLTLEGPGGDSLYICHASPEHNARSYIQGVDAAMALAMSAVSSRTIVAGHIHAQWTGAWADKRLVICGSVGLPHHGKPEAEYALLLHGRGEWRADLRTVPYDQAAALREYRESGALEQGGPMAWMLYDELWCATPRLAYFLPRVLSSQDPKPQSLAAWALATKGYLEHIGRWGALGAALGVGHLFEALSGTV